MESWGIFLLLLGSCFIAQVASNEKKDEEHQAHPRGPGRSHWNYQDTHEWDSSFPHCGGSEQSPINVNTSSVTFDASLRPIRLSGYNVTPEETLKLKNNGHTVVLDLPDNLLIIEGLAQTYRAAQLHFHWGSESSPGSEHTVNGHRFPGEIHVVHYSAEYDSIWEAVSRPGGLAVLAAFIEEGADENPTYERLLSHLRSVAEEGQTTNVTGFDIRGLLPRRLDRYYRYNGSLTTPPCFQSVNWTIFNQTIPLSPRQLAVLEDTIHTDHDHVLQMNFRLPQSLNGRHVLTSFGAPVGGRRAFGGGPVPAVVTDSPDGPGNEEKGAQGGEEYTLSTGDMLAIIFGVLFGVTAVAFFVYVRKNRTKNQRTKAENKSNVIYKVATTEENLA
ncbi:carbonic anhydrase 9 [Spea bombifrons]|uniref:carbonic anhydrase 9 n=1 Tax=Spea bombifrons TaxID=233779 RepID=UPI00234AB185|nr:carbonic anhydrase 9 [Spea bombifrons]